jgi:hypothetical protein
MKVKSFEPHITLLRLYDAYSENEMAVALRSQKGNLL